MHRIRTIGLASMLLASLGVLSACHPTEEEYQAKEAEVTQLKAKLGEAEQRGSSLETRLKEMSDNNAQLAKFATQLEKTTVDTVESGFMTKDLALLVGADQKWLSTTGFLDKVSENLTKAMA